MVETWRAIDWAQIDALYPYGTHVNDSGMVKDQLKAALFNEYEKVFQMGHDRVQDKGRGNAQISSAATPDIGVSLFDLIHITGSVNITGFVAANPGTERELIFDAAPLLTYHATNLKLPGGVNIQVAAGDRATFRCEGNGAYPGASGNYWTCTKYTRVDGMPVGRRGAANGAADDGILDVNSDNALSTAGDYLVRARNATVVKAGWDFAGYEYYGTTRVGRRVNLNRNSYEAGIGSFIVNGAWHTATSGGGGSDERFSLASIVPSGAIAAKLAMRFRDNTANLLCAFSPDHVTYNRGYPAMKILASNVDTYKEFTVMMPADDSRKIEYFFDTGFDDVLMVVIGYEI